MGRDARTWRAYATHFLGRSLVETSRFAASLVDAGFSAVKFGWPPLGPDADQDEAIVESLRRSVGASVDVLIDAGNAWDAPTAIERWKRFTPYDIYWLEEPLPAYDMPGYAELTAHVDGRITAGELSSSHEELGRLIEEGHVRTVQVDISRTGITQAMKVAAIAERHDAASVNHTYSLDWNLAASLHFIAAIARTELFEYPAAPNEIREALVKNRPDTN